ncbi:hypothetical protein PV11_03632 [Exophiala sideris]|uniref:PI-PLC Y-box domain-containing protein n=1 Tax=Exophiala sideris TaxID=1016849 RepID=A0A0D1Z3J9_9EURO|nr:hypothetical protein PV11_03632 [Exophiala sideris]
MRAETPLLSSRKPTRNQRNEPLSPLQRHDVASNRPVNNYSSGAGSVQDRIQQWQAQSAANAVDPDALSVRSIPRSDVLSIGSKPKSEYGDENELRVGGRTKDRVEEVVQTERSKSAPRKRIISDSHWKAKAGIKDQRHAKSAPKPRPESAHYDLSYTTTGEKPKERRRSRRHHETGTDSPNSPLDDGIRVKLGPVDEYPIATEDRPHSPDVDSFGNHPTMDSVLFDEPDRYSEILLEADESTGRIRPQSKYVATLGREAATPLEAERSKMGGLLGKTRDMFLKPQPVPPVHNRIPSIEAWLDEQPDPFVDQRTPDELPPVEAPQPLRKETRRKERQRPSLDKSPLPDPNQIWESVEPRDETQSRQTSYNDGIPLPPQHGDQQSTPSHRRDNSKDTQNNEDPSTPLRRSGARVRRQRESPSRRGTPTVEQPSSPEIPVREFSTLGLGEQSPRQERRPTEPKPAPAIPVEETKLPPQEPSNGGGGLQRRLTTHEELMSIISQPRGHRSRRSRRRPRSTRVAQDSNGAQEVLVALVADEEKYGQELKTLVDGVIPVLLQSVLSKTDSAAAAGLFTASSTQDDVGVTKPIIEMGIALERLKSLHARFPLQQVDSLLNWAQTAQKAYKEYFQAWRLGFQDVIVNLAPLDDASPAPQSMAKDEVGDLIDNEGRKVDVAYLLKRPLVRVKNLSKSFDQIREQYDRPLATQAAEAFSELTALAKRRHREEQARLEDEAAANIDTSRTRDIRTMAPTAGVVLDKSRRVNARDFFNLTLYHTSGQRMDCGIELVFRDNAPGDDPGGDVLICEVDDTGKWLLFPPVLLSSISARRGEAEFDLVIMVRGRAGLGQEWHELLALKTEDKEASTEWMNMLGSNPLPPRLNRTPSLKSPQLPSAVETAPAKSDSGKQGQKQEQLRNDQGPAQQDVDLPIGEPSVILRRSDVNQRPDSAKPLIDRPVPSRLNLGGDLASKPETQYQTQPTVTIKRRPIPSINSSDRSTLSDHSIRQTSTTDSSSLRLMSDSPYATERKADPLLPRSSPQQPLVPERSTGVILPVPREARDNRQDRIKTGSESPGLGTSLFSTPINSPKGHTQMATPETQHHSYSPWSTEPNPPSSVTQDSKTQRPIYHRALSSTPSKDLPTVSRIRPSPHKASDMGDVQSVLAASYEKDRSPREKEKRSPRSTKDVSSPQAPAPQSLPPLPISPTITPGPTPPQTPPHGRSRTLRPQTKRNHTPDLGATPERSSRRRTSSPLKHEYAPSTSSGTPQDYDTEAFSDSSSDTSEDFDNEGEDKVTPLVAVAAGDGRPSKQACPPSSMPSTGTRTLAPSDSASQGPYRRVPSSSTVPEHKRRKAIATVSAWSNAGKWEDIHQDECSVVVSPGLVEVFEMSAAHSNSLASPGGRFPTEDDSRSSSMSEQPLVAFELTPLVLLRQGAACDIQIRSPSTPNSRIQTTSHVMFRSRNVEECKALYTMINWARCNNPTYIELERARARQPTVAFNIKQEEQKTSGRSASWFNFGSPKKTSYRASSAPTPASVDVSVESSGTMTNAFSALRIFSAKPAFNLNRSSVLRKPGGGTGASLYSSSSGGTGPRSGSSTPVPSQLGFIPGKDGPNVPSTSADAANGGGMINNMKIRLYQRKGQNWENMGAARMSVLPAPTGAIENGTTPPTTPTQSRGRVYSEPIGQPGQARGPRLASSGHTPHRIHGNGREKRILIVRNKTPDVVLLDAVLGESCFERIMQTSIAVSVWKEAEEIGHTGGVTMGKDTKYMLVFKSNREAGWVFGLCGTYRYGHGQPVDG